MMLIGATVAMMLAAASPAFAQGATTVNLQTCLAYFGDQTAVQYQAGTQYSVQDLTQAQIQYCQQIIQNITAGGEVVFQPGEVVFVPHAQQYVVEGTEIVVVFDEAAGAFVPAEETLVLPDTGGISLLALGAGALLIAGGLLARRISR
ncbi:LPXTG cell wall anchor domain-containing protein [Rubrobacter taiwanensis]|uniref:LPXTG cell wall anchor domain-containing protein n=1 Tax=Rubrobacter taiwanensis TaxID=185139 RepID=A0A4R1BE75_9ACTN|nr:LPXTG cell wall anchor domain-containing protein [Rubrobacter taiwanensis]